MTVCPKPSLRSVYFQSYNLIAQLTVLENNQVPLQYQGKTCGIFMSAAWSWPNCWNGRPVHHRPNQLSADSNNSSPSPVPVNEPLMMMRMNRRDISTQNGRSLGLIGRLNEAGKTIVLVTHYERSPPGAPRDSLKDGQGDREVINEAWGTICLAVG